MLEDCNTIPAILQYIQKNYENSCVFLGFSQNIVVNYIEMIYNKSVKNILKWSC